MTTKQITTLAEKITLAEYAKAKTEAEKATKALAAARSAVEDILGDAEALEVDGVTVVTYDEVKTSRFDVSKFKGENPGVYVTYLVDTVSRRFLWKGLPA